MAYAKVFSSLYDLFCLSFLVVEVAHVANFFRNLCTDLACCQLVAIRDELFETFRKRHNDADALVEAQLTAESLQRYTIGSRLASSQVPFAEQLCHIAGVLIATVQSF